MLRKYARFEVLAAQMGGFPALAGGIQRTAHRATFDYEPREGFLYVRSRAISSRTNDNFDHFPAEEIRKAYKTFIGKPVFVNHHNANHRRARGVIIDAALHEDRLPDGGEDTWVEVLMEIDAVRFPKLAKAILAGRIDRTSMGTDVAFSVCSACGNKASTPLEYCRHIPAQKGQKIRRKTASGTQEDVLVYERCYGLRFFENSVLVEDPADPTAFFLEVDDRGVGGGYQGDVPMTKAASRRTASRRTAAFDGPGERAHLDGTITKHLGLYDGNISWLLQHRPDATAEQVATKIMERNAPAVRKMTGHEGWVVDQDEWWPKLVAATQAMLDEIHAGPGATASRRTAAQHYASRRTASWESLDGKGYAWGDAGSDDYILVGGGGYGSDIGYHGRIDGDLVAESGFATIDEARAAADAVIDLYRTGSQARRVASDGSRKHAYGETTAPARVDTLRDDHCPVCGEQDAFNGERCSVCQFVKPPDEFMDPDLSLAQETDLRQQADQLEEAADEKAAEDDGVPGDDVPSDDLFTLEKPKDDDPEAEGLGEEDPSVDGQTDADVVGLGDEEAEAFEDAEDDEDAPDDDDDEEGEDDDSPFSLKRKRKKATRRHPRGIPKEESKDPTMRPTLKALAEQQIMLEADRKAIRAIARLAGIDVDPIYAEGQRRIAALNRRTADSENPAQPVPEPSAEPASESTDEALGELNEVDVETPGGVSTEGVAPDATIDVTQPGGSGTPDEAELGNPSDLDVTAPVEGTTEMRPDNEVKPESDVKARDGVDTETAFPEQFTGSKERTFAALRLARLRIQAGIAKDANDLALGESIASSNLSDEAIQSEIVTLTKVQAAAAKAPAAPQQRVAGARSVPSLGGSVAPSAPIGGSGGSNVSSVVDDADVFL